jgi:hypothetical protein
MLVVSGETADDLTTMTVAFKPLIKGEIANSNKHSLTFLEGKGAEFKKPQFAISATQNQQCGNVVYLT